MGERKSLITNHITDYGGAIDDYYPARIERIADMELTEWEKRADIEAEKSRMKPEVLDPPAKDK